jgi:hypothetical protein
MAGQGWLGAEQIAGFDFDPIQAVYGENTTVHHLLYVVGDAEQQLAFCDRLAALRGQS